MGVQVKRVKIFNVRISLQLSQFSLRGKKNYDL